MRYILLLPGCNTSTMVLAYSSRSYMYQKVSLKTSLHFIVRNNGSLVRSGENMRVANGREEIIKLILRQHIFSLSCNHHQVEEKCDTDERTLGPTQQYKSEQ